MEERAREIPGPPRRLKEKMDVIRWLLSQIPKDEKVDTSKNALSAPALSSC
jgi:hypothetical protein